MSTWMPASFPPATCFWAAWVKHSRANLTSGSCGKALRQIENRVALEEVDGPDEKRMPHCGHDWPVFRTRDVVESQRVPANDVRIRDGPVGLGPGAEAIGPF